jgi:RNA polymerase sporulation-specific sigma factor
MIEGEIRKYLRDNNTIRISRSVKENAYKILKYKNDYIMNYGKEPSLEGISKKLNIDKKDILQSLEATKSIISYFDPIYDDGGETIYLYDQLSTNDKDVLDEVILKNAIDNLKLKEKQVFTDRYINGKTQMELSEELNISQAQVSRIEKNALKNIKKLIK